MGANVSMIGTHWEMPSIEPHMQDFLVARPGNPNDYIEPRWIQHRNPGRAARLFKVQSTTDYGLIMCAEIGETGPKSNAAFLLKDFDGKKLVRKQAAK